MTKTLDEILDLTTNTDKPEVKQMVKDLMLEKVRNTPTLGPPHPQTTLYIEALEKEFSEL